MTYGTFSLMAEVYISIFNMEVSSMKAKAAIAMVRITLFSRDKTGGMMVVV